MPKGVPKRIRRKGVPRKKVKKSLSRVAFELQLFILLGKIPKCKRSI